MSLYEFIYPNITDVKVTIEGVPNMVYSQGVGKEYLYKEATRFFGSELTKDSYLNVESFYKDKFALVIDLRATRDAEASGQGKEIVNTQNGVLLEIKKKAYSSDLVCSLFVISYGLINFINNGLQNIQY